MADLKRSNEDMKKSMQSSDSKYEQFMKEKKMEVKEKVRSYQGRQPYSPNLT